MSIIKNGKISIPLFHGTTELFIDSIREYGLGAIDPFTKIQAKEFMHELFNLAESQGWNDSEWIEYRKTIKPIIDQEKKNNNFNFQHGGTYLTYSPELAIKYADENPCGCEYLTYARILLWIAVSRKIEGLNERFLKNPILKLWEQPHHPYVITVKDVSVDDLEPEAGQNFEEHILEIEKLLKRGIYGPQSFLLKNPIKPKLLEIKKLN